MKREAAIHSKTGRLARILGIEHWGAIGILESLWHLTARETPAGDIGKLSNEDIAYGVWWKGDPDKLVQALAESSWLDVSEEHRLLIHDWSEHADDGVHQKLAKAVRFFADGTIPKLSRLVKTEQIALLKEFERLKALKSASCAENRAYLAKPSQASAVPLPDAIGDPVSPEAARKQQQPAAPSEVFLAATGTDAPRANGHSHGPTLVSRPRPMTDAEWGAHDTASIVEKLVNELALSHPTPGSVEKAFNVAAIEAAKQPDAETWSIQVRKTHAHHRIVWERKLSQNPNAYIPNLAVWFRDGDYKHIGVSAGKSNSSQPSSEPPPKYSPVPPEARNYGLKTK